VTLAAHAGIFLNLEVVRPELAERLAAELDFPHDFYKQAELIPSREQLLAAASRVGAGVVVWGEIESSGRVRLHAEALAPDANTAPWDGLEVALGDDLERGVYDAPRMLLAAMLGEGRVDASLLTTAAPGEGPQRERFETALRELATGHPAAIRRAELELARLAAEHPGWSAAWVQLALVRTLRAALYPRLPGGEHLSEGPNPARHIALLFPDLPDEDRARLAVVDEQFLGHLQGQSEFDALIERLPHDFTRALMAWQHEGRDPGRFGLDGVPAQTAFEQSLVGLVAAPSPADAEKVAKRLGEEAAARGDLRRNPFLVRALREIARDRSDWWGDYGLQIVGVLPFVSGAVEAIRGRCEDLTEASREACLQGLTRFLAPYTGADAIHDWSGALDAFEAAFLAEPLPKAGSDRLPTLPIFAKDPTFGGLWFLASSLLEVANASIAAYDEASGPLATRPSLLALPVRDGVSDATERVIAVAYTPALIGGQKRAQADEAKGYVRPLEPFGLHFALAKFYQLKLSEALGKKAFYARDANRLVAREPHVHAYLERWIGVAALNETREGRPMLENTPTILGEILPRTETLQMYRANALERLGRKQEALATLEETLAVKPHGGLALDRDKLLRTLGERDSKRIALLEPTLEQFPKNMFVRSQLARLYRQSGRLELAERLFRSHLETPNLFKEACLGLASLETARERPDAARETLSACAERAPDHWIRASLSVRAGALHQVAGDFDAALAAYRKAYGDVKAAGWVLRPYGFTQELSGDLAGAEQTYRYEEKLYGGDTGGGARHARARLYLRQGLVADAIHELRKMVESGSEDAEDYELLGLALLRKGARDELQHLCGEHSAAACSLGLIEVLWHHLGDPDAALAVAGRMRARWPDDSGIWLLEARILVDDGRPLEAIPVLEKVRARDFGVYDPWYELVRAQARAGRVEAARETTRDFRERYPLQPEGHEMEALVARASGDLAKAQAALDLSHHIDPWYETDSLWYWLAEERRLLREAELGFYRTDARKRERMTQRTEAVLARLHEHADLWALLARLRLAAGDPSGSDQAKTQAAVLNPVRYAERVARKQTAAQ
ncbi:MAG: tetratricopeptide repeat protein, partial [Candidatus Limnocylindria bacterium]